MFLEQPDSVVYYLIVLSIVKGVFLVNLTDIWTGSRQLWTKKRTKRYHFLFLVSNLSARDFSGFPGWSLCGSGSTTTNHKSSMAHVRGQSSTNSIKISKKNKFSIQQNMLNFLHKMKIQFLKLAPLNLMVWF